MHLKDLFEDTPRSSIIPEEPQPQEDEFSVVTGLVYIFTPVHVKDKDGELHSLLTVYSHIEDEIKPYSINGTDPIIFKVIRLDAPMEDTRIVRVQILSDVDVYVDKFDIENEQVVTNLRGVPFSLKLKQLPDFNNLDLISDETFEDTFGHRRKPYEHGLVGHLYLDFPPTAAEDFNTDDVGNGQDYTTGYDTTKHFNTTGQAVKHGQGKPSGRGDLIHHNAAVKRYNERTDAEHHQTSKMQQAIALYKSNLALPRVAVIKLMMSRLSMTRAGASSYYTKAMHAVEDEKKDET